MDETHNSDLRIVGGHLVLDLVNTVAPRTPDGSGHHEYLPGPEELLAWARRVDVLDEREAGEVAAAWRAAPDSAAQAWRAALEIREAVYAVLSARLPAAADSTPSEGAGTPTGGDGTLSAAGDAPSEGAGTSPVAGRAPDPGPALERLALRWATAAARSALVLDGRPGRAARLVVGTAPALLVPDRLASAAVEFLSTVDLDRLKVCPVAEGGCGWLFLDITRNGSRRWCAMADCGAQAKSRRLTERRRARRATGVTANTGS
ncbi:CGNR zinc finger domain-containing protein [Microbispora corallina]|nr:CGNR zinc finger domain-containing protein [Microbispora corallina]